LKKVPTNVTIKIRALQEKIGNQIREVLRMDGKDEIKKLKKQERLHKKRDAQLARAGFSAYGLLEVIDPPKELKPLIEEMLPSIPFHIPMRKIETCLGETYLRDTKMQGEKFERPNIYTFTVGAVMTTKDAANTAFAEFSPEIIVLPDGRVSFVLSRYNYRKGLDQDLSAFNLYIEEQRGYFLERIEKESARLSKSRKN
jgi:hypothetical protein